MFKSLTYIFVTYTSNDINSNFSYTARHARYEEGVPISYKINLDTMSNRRPRLLTDPPMAGNVTLPEAGTALRAPIFQTRNSWLRILPCRPPTVYREWPAGIFRGRKRRQVDRYRIILRWVVSHAVESPAVMFYERIKSKRIMRFARS